MRILLLQPPWDNHLKTDRPPLGIAYIAAVLEKEGYEVQIKDMFLRPGIPIEKQVREYMEFDPQIVGISTVTSTHSNGEKVAGIIKNINQDVITIVGGPHASALPKEVIKNPNVDFVVRGEGEITFLELCRHIESGKNIEYVCSVTFISKGKVISTPNRELIKNLDEIPFPARHLLDINEYSLEINGKKATTMISTRGCPFNCIFCFKGVFGNTYRERSVSNIIEEIKQINDTYNIYAIYFQDDLFFLNRRRVKEFCKTLKKEKVEIDWSCFSRVDLMEKDLLNDLSEANCYRIHYGVESGSNKILKLLHKNIEKRKIKEIFQETHRAGIKTRAYFILGLPFDTPETIVETIKFAFELKTDELQFSIATPWPGTPLWNMLEKKDVNFSQYIFMNLRSKNHLEPAPLIIPSRICNEGISVKELIDIILSAGCQSSRR
ncbi:MAG: B12-binding domain-containing radical SAM protein [Candidatus Desulfofervidus auxilii]|nr:B12-binding domain-containing radical SAM protein [Candidatus Desulfofervidus auxilii]